MANTLLEIGADLSEAFVAAQEDAGVRALKATIVDERITLSGTAVASGGGTVADDFDNLASDLDVHQANFILFKLGGEGEAQTGWTLISWVPDLCKVRDKMLYSSSRDNLKRSLGHGYFSNE